MAHKTTNYFVDGVATVTGAASGIGRATAVTFARDGCVRLMLGDRDLEGLEKTKSLISTAYPDAKVEISPLDISDEAQVEEFFNLAVKHYGRIDFAASVAEIGQTPIPAHKLKGADFDRLYQFNQRGTFFCQRALIRIMLKQDPLPGSECRGSIVNVTSICATAPLLGLTAYSATQAACVALTKTDALDYGPEKIRLNSVAPGNIIGADVALGTSDAQHHQLAEKTTLKRNGKLEDVANAVCWLSSPQAAFITGLHFPVDGGLHLFNPS